MCASIHIMLFGLSSSMKYDEGPARESQLSNLINDTMCITISSMQNESGQEYLSVQNVFGHKVDMTDKELHIYMYVVLLAYYELHVFVNEFQLYFMDNPFGTHIREKLTIPSVNSLKG